MKLVVIQQRSELDSLREQWGNLLNSSGTCNTFISWEWITAWWAHYGTGEGLQVLAAFDKDNVLRGIAPLRFQKTNKFGQTVRALAFVGDGSVDSDYMDFVVAGGYEEPVMNAFLTHLASELSRGTVLTLNEIPESSASIPYLRTFAEAQNAYLGESNVPCATVSLPETWDQYLRILRPRFRTKVRSVLRTLEERPGIRFGFCENQAQVDKLLPVLFDLHTRRWGQEGKPGVFGRMDKRDFYFSLSALLLERGWLRFSWLDWNGRILACQYGFVLGATYYHLQEGYEPDSEHWNVGVGLRAWSLRQLQQQGCREYDFLGGVSRHKTDWGAQTKNSKNFVIAGRGLKNLLFCRGPEWEVNARESVRRLVPEPVLRVRESWLTRKSRAVAQTQHNGHVSDNGRGLARHVAASCYLHSGLPFLMRHIRNQYQFSITLNGRFPRLACERRTEGSVRIFCYHRVNNDADPFFPAISAELFEQEMAFVARHYKVVSLADALSHLETGSRESALAITFDDGYQDNFDYAYPILRRYGIPATIFLATGSIDSREPLWFEQVAEALKRTALESLDVEIDIPRRFWLRNREERLATNASIFELLRVLPDSERRRLVTEILCRLQVPGDREREGKMLTWDAIRAMAGHGIEFGGHTVTHPFLSRMPAAQVSWEIVECKRRIEDELQRQVRFFAYPNGREQDYGSWNKELIRDAGYQAAVTTIWGINQRGSDPLELRRSSPWEEDPVLFASKLDWYQLVNG